MRTVTERLPVSLAKHPLPASRTQYYPAEAGQDRLASEHLVEFVKAEVYSDKAGTLTLEESHDGTTWATTDTLTVSAATKGKTGWVKLSRTKWRWKYVNGAATQTTFQLLEDKTPDDPTNSPAAAKYDTATHTAVAVATTTTAVIAANPDRKYLHIINDSDTDVDLKFGAAAVAGEGVPLQAGGGQMEMSVREGNLFTGAINGIHAGTGTKNVRVLEGV